MRFRITAASGLFALALSAGVALGEVTVYSNPFSSHAAIADLQKIDGGKDCKRGWLKHEKAVTLEIGDSAAGCAFSTPVRGDTLQPDHAVEIEATVAKGPPKSAQDEIAVALTVRSNGSAGYELRIVPGTRAWELRRDPEGQGFPMQGSDAAIEGLGKANRVLLQAFGDQVTAVVNGQRLVDGFVDPAAGQVDGRRTTVALVSEAEVEQGVVATVDDLEVRIPDPP